jgi:hypothetical protein
MHHAHLQHPRRIAAIPLLTAAAAAAVTHHAAAAAAAATADDAVYELQLLPADVDALLVHSILQQPRRHVLVPPAQQQLQQQRQDYCNDSC